MSKLFNLILDGKSLLTNQEFQTSADLISPASLAYLGDGVYELYLRSYYLFPAKRIVDYHQQVVTQVKAETQAQHLRSILPYLTEKEKEILKKGRNAATGKPRRLPLTIYQQATSLEALIGYLYLTDPQRLQEIFNYFPLKEEVSNLIN